MQPVATSCNSNSPSPTPSLPLEKQILKYLATCEIAQSPKIIALRIKAKPTSVRCALRRLAQTSKVVSEDGLYKIPSKDFERGILDKMQFDMTERTLPKVHDIHLKFDPKQLREILSQHKETCNLFDQVAYTMPDASELQNVNIDSCKKIAPLSQRRLDSVLSNISDNSFIKKFSNPIDPDSCYQLWKPNLKAVKEISGGFQERFDLRNCRITFQLFGTGTIMIQVKNSETPFTAIQFKACLDTIDGIFLARTGVHFWDISSLFFIDQIHINNDTGSDYEYSGTSRLNCTVRQFDDFLMRVYEKVIDGQSLIRSEICIDKGNYDDHNLNSMLALIMGGVNPTLNTAQIFKTSKNQEELVGTISKLARMTEQTQKMILTVNDRIDRIEARKR